MFMMFTFSVMFIISVECQKLSTLMLFLLTYIHTLNKNLILFHYFNKIQCFSDDWNIHGSLYALSVHCEPAAAPVHWEPCGVHSEPIPIKKNMFSEDDKALRQTLSIENYV